MENSKYRIFLKTFLYSDDKININISYIFNARRIHKHQLYLNRLPE